MRHDERDPVGPPIFFCGGYNIWNTLAKAGVPRYAEIVVIADALGEAAVNYVVLRMMGFADVKVWAPARR